MKYTRARWAIVALLFLATTINYIDRQTLSILSPLLRQELNLSEGDYSNIVTAFLIPYTVMYALSGLALDRVGVRIGLTLGIVWWSIATMLTGFARSATSLGIFRFLLGIGEPCVFPAGVKVSGEWFPAKLRATATGIFSSGSAIGAVLAPPVAAWLTLQYGWQYAFLVPGLCGLLWAPIWWWVYRPLRQHPGVTQADIATIGHPATATAAQSWKQLLTQRKVWGLILPRVFSDPVWYFYIFWLPDYLQRERGLSLTEIGYYGWIPFLFADLGHIFGGSLSDFLIRRGIPPAKARMLLLSAVGCLAPLGALAGIVPTVSIAIAITCLVAALSQCWSTNISALAADIVPNGSVGTVFGLMGMAGSLAGALFAQVLGYTITHFGYQGAFALAALLHPCAATILYFFLWPATRTSLNNMGNDSA